MKADTLQVYKERMLRVLVFIQQQLDETLSLEDLARRACFSPYHFHRIFRGMLGESVKSHVRRLRMERAAMRLKLGSMGVTQIAFDAGYETHEAFTRAFKAQFGVSPSKFRSSRSPLHEFKVPSGVHFTEGRSLRRFKTLPPRTKMNVTIKQLEPLRVAFVRHVGPYNQVGSAWDKLLAYLGNEGLLNGHNQFIGICHDDPEVTPADKIRYDACVTVGEAFTPHADIGVQTIAGGSYAMTTHFGPYDQLGQTYARLLGQWLPRSGYELGSSPCLEMYLNDPQSTDPADLITDIYAPLSGAPVMEQILP